MLTTLCIVALILLVTLSAFFSASETAYTSLNKIRLKNIAKDGDVRADRALKLGEDFEKLLTTILVGNNLVNILSSALCTWLFTVYFGTWGVLIATLFMLIVLLTFGEITPKCFAKANAEKLAMTVSRALTVVMVVLSPLIWVFNKMSSSFNKRLTKDSENHTLTEEELVVMIDEIQGEGTLEKSESELIKSAIEFDDITVGEIYTPRVDILAADISTPSGPIRDLFLSSGFSRIPVFDGTIDKIVGVVHAKDFYPKYFENQDLHLEDIMRPVQFFPESASIAKVLTALQKSKIQLAVVLDSYGGTLGIVSMEDIIEELVGEIWDESDEVQHSIIKDVDGTYAVIGDANVFDVMEDIGVKFDPEEFDDHTVGGYLQYKLGKIPAKGDVVNLPEATLTVKSTKNRRVRLVQIAVIPKVEPKEEDL